MAPFGIFGNSGKGPSKQTLNNIRAKQDAARRAEQERAQGGQGSRQPIVSQPGHASMMSREMQGADAHTAASGGFLSFVRDCCPTLPFERWFGGGRRGDLESATDPGAYRPLESREGHRSRGEDIQLTDRRQGSPQPLAGAEPAVGATGLRHVRSQTLPSDSPAPSVRFESQFSPAEATARDRGEPALRKRRHSETPNPTPAAETAATRKSSLPQPEGWSLSDTPPRRERDMPPAALRNAESFKEYIRQGYSPIGAVKMMGPGTVPKQLKASNGQFEIRLNQHHRLTYRVDNETKVLTILEIGGHT